LSNSSYVKGRSREYGAMRRLREMGALDVSRSYGSHGMFDIRAVFPDHVRLIQVKGSYMTRREFTGLKKFSHQLTCNQIKVEIWRYRNRKLEIQVL